MSIRVFALVSVLQVVVPCTLAAETIRVPQDQPTVAAGLAAAGPGDVVLVACGTYLEHDLVMESGVTLRGETGDPACVTLDGEKQGEILQSVGVDSNASVEGITFNRGGVSCVASSPSFTRCRFLNSGIVGSYGGMGCWDGSNPTITDCLFAYNESFGPGGGLWCYYSSPTILRCTFDQNFASKGGGGAVGGYNSSPVLSECSFSGNGSSYSAPGAVQFDGGSPFLSHCSFVGNTGAVGLGGASATIVHCTMVGNGGGLAEVIKLWSSSLVLEKSIIAFNSTPSVSSDPDDPSTADVSCCDIYGNTGGDWVGSFTGQLGMNGNLSRDPLLCGAPADLRLNSSSPCVAPQLSAECGDFLGAWGVGCGAASVPVTPGKAVSWGAMKLIHGRN